jgi:D-3-phosphoglycerate dehydrogenase / 2-oxoglutarate reductase
MRRILANDGIALDGKKILEKEGFIVDDSKIPQNELSLKLNGYDAVLVRSATKITREVIDGASSLKLICRAGVGLDNIDVDYAYRKGIEVINTPKSSSLSVAELVFAHIFGISRFLHQSNRELPVSAGKDDFNRLKKKYSAGVELRGKTLGIIGFGRIGQETAKIAISLGMEIMVYDPQIKQLYLKLDHLRITPIPEIAISTTSFDDVLENSDFITLHIPHTLGNPPVFSAGDFSRMKKGAGIINCARGGVLNESDLVKALDSGQLSYAALDVFDNEPDVAAEVLKHPKISLSPHTGASTVEAQDRVGVEIAEKIVEFFKG